MKIVNKIFIFEPLLQAHTTPRCDDIQRHLERPCISCNLWRGNLGLWFLQGLFICSWLQFNNVHISGVRLHNTLKRALLVSAGFLSDGIWCLASTTNKTEFPLTCILRDRSETINDRQPKLKDNSESKSLTGRGRGLDLFLSPFAFQFHSLQPIA